MTPLALSEKHVDFCGLAHGFRHVFRSEPHNQLTHETCVYLTRPGKSITCNDLHRLVLMNPY